MPKFILSKPNIIWILKVISTSLCHVRKTIKRNKHEQKGYTLKKRLFLTATSFQSLHVLQYGKGRKRESVQVFSPDGHRHIGKREGTGGKDVLWEICKWRILFILTQEAQPKIIDSVTHFRLRILCENIYQSCMRIQNGRIYSSKSYLSESVICVGEFQSIESFCLLWSSFQTMQNFMFSRLHLGTFLCK